MKTIKDIESEINESLRDIKSAEFYDGSKVKRLTKRVSFLRLVKIYLEFNPRQEFIESEKIKLTRLIDSAANAWDDHYNFHRATFDKLPQEMITKKKNEFLKDIPVSEYKKQLETINYILS